MSGTLPRPVAAPLPLPSLPSLAVPRDKLLARLMGLTVLTSVASAARVVLGILDGQTYSHAPAKAPLTPEGEAPPVQRTALRQGKTLRGLLLSAWGRSLVAMSATLAGIIPLVIDVVLFLLPPASWHESLHQRTSKSGA